MRRELLPGPGSSHSIHPDLLAPSCRGICVTPHGPNVPKERCTMHGLTVSWLYTEGNAKLQLKTVQFVFQVCSVGREQSTTIVTVGDEGSTLKTIAVYQVGNDNGLKKS